MELVTFAFVVAGKSIGEFKIAKRNLKNNNLKNLRKCVQKIRELFPIWKFHRPYKIRWFFSIHIFLKSQFQRIRRGARFENLEKSIYEICGQLFTCKFSYKLLHFSNVFRTIFKDLNWLWRVVERNCSYCFMNGL